MRWRRARNLVGYWAADGFRLENPLTRRIVRVDVSAVRILAEFTDWADPAEVAVALGYSAGSFDTGVRALAERHLLVAEGDLHAAEDDRLADSEWRDWGATATALHFGTKNTPYQHATDELRAAMVAESPSPPLFKAYPDAPRILLPRMPCRLDAPFGDVLYGRRTHRTFAPDPVSRHTLSTLLAAVFGPKDFLHAGEFGALMLRTSPSGGARHALEAYVVPLRVPDVERGLYHYNPLEHSLELLTEQVTGEQLAVLCHDQTALEQAAFVVVLTAVVHRMSWKYPGPRAYRVLMLDAGHLGQSFVLTATALGLGPFQTAAFADEEVEALLGVDGVRETALYVLAAGMPDADPAGAVTFLHPPAGLAAFRDTRL
ncbi:MAG TPA: SagB/ThcOx family dehydrogenase [Pseudonocardiaceae bacterium]|nr:SagB/ThcOx family dehydrogenase [Pseudonocardiaceae bacterium]